MSIRGIDVSYFQGNVDWEAVKASGIRFAMLRAGYGVKTVDAQFKRNASECNRLGIPIGVYWFSYAYTTEMAQKEAEACIRTIQDFRIEYPVAFDYENESINYAKKNGATVTPALVTAMIDAFCKKVEKLGYFAMYYGNNSFLKQWADSSLRKKYALWYARYQSELGIADLGMWQYSNTGKVSGISGNTDMNISYYDFPKVIAKAGLNHLSGAGGRKYTVRQGDTLSEIAVRFGTTVKELQRLNNIQNPDRIYAGQVIRLGTG